MRTFTQKPKATQQTTPARSAIPGRANFGPIPEVRSILNAQRTVGNQAVQRALQNNVEEPKAGLDRTDLSRFGQGSSQIPVHPRVAAIQTKRTINNPKNRHEHVADALSEQVMPLREQQLLRACAWGEERPKCKAKNMPLPISHPGDASEIEADRIAEKVMRKQEVEPVNSHKNNLQRKESGDVANSFTPQIVREVLSSGGKPLEADIRAFMESRFNRDFSNVKIHDNKSAAKSASSINALAYTSGHNVVFNSGQYAPDTEAGKKLLAHELAHVMQQGDGNATNRIQRFSDTDHHIVEEVALDKVFSKDEIKSIEQGNMQRDYSQVPAGANALLLGTKDKFGGYKPHEHFDNFIFDREKNRWVSHDEFEKFWDDKTGQWVKRAVPSLKKTGTPKMTPLQYIEGEFLIAVKKDMPDSESFVHLGNAFHTIEDFFAHSNFVELTKGDYSAGRELTTQAPGEKGPEPLTAILSDVSDVGSGAHFADKFKKEREKASQLSHGRLAKDYHLHPNHSMAITLAALVVRKVGMMLKDAFALKTKEERSEYVQNMIMTTLSSYFRPPSDENKWWEKLLATDRGVTARRIKARQDATPITVNQIPGSPLRSFEATKFSSWKAIGLGTSVSIPLKNSTFFTAGYMLYLPGTGSTLDDKIFVAPRSDWEQRDMPSFILGAQISGSFDEMNFFKKGR